MPKTIPTDAEKAWRQMRLLVICTRVHPNGENGASGKIAANIAEKKRDSGCDPANVRKESAPDSRSRLASATKELVVSAILTFFRNYKMSFQLLGIFGLSGVSARCPADSV